MNPNSGEFEDGARAKAWMERVKVGEVVKIKGEELEIVSIAKRTITLKLLSADDRLRSNFDDVVQSYEESRDIEIERQMKKLLKHQ
jgi:hypothetical protein